MLSVVLKGGRSERAFRWRGSTYSSAQCEVATEAHAGRADQARTCGQAEEVVDGPVRVLVVRLERLLDLPLVAHVGSRDVVGQRLRAGKVMV